MALPLPIPLTRRPLEPADESLLYGRAAETKTIVQNCEFNRLTVVSAAPGMGISSLLRAGVAPALKRAGFITVVYSDWQGRSIAANLIAAIATAIHEQADGAFSAEPEPLREFIDRAENKTGRGIAILLDHFEEYLRCHAGTDVSDDLDASLSNAISARVGRLVIGLHSPSLTAFDRLSQYIPNLLGNHIALPPLSPETAGAMIERAAAAAGLKLEPAALGQLLACPQVADRSGVHPLFAKLAAERLFEAEFNLKSSIARATTIAANGGVERMILESLDPVIMELGSTHLELFFRWIPLLIGPDRRRLAVSEKALVEHSGKWNRFALTLLPLLVKTGLLRTIEMPGGVRYEIAREAMTTIIHDWWTRKEAAIVARQRATFRVRSVSIAVGAILMAYLVYVAMTLKKP